MSASGLLRSWLYVPADDPRKIAKAAAGDADVAILDLEDGCPADRKQQGRECVAAALADTDFGDTRRYVRINAIDTPHWRADLEATLGADGYVLAKAASPSAVTQVTAVLRDRLGDATPLPDVVPIVTEDLESLFAAQQTMTADPLVATVIWGSEDLSASLGAWSVRDDDEQPLEVFRVIRSYILLAAKRHGKAILDTPYLRIGDLDGLRREARLVARMGFTGKQAIHPSHVPIINEVFVPDAETVRAARELVGAFGAGGAAVLRVEDNMNDAPHLLRARAILALAEAAGQLTT